MPRGCWCFCDSRIVLLERARQAKSEYEDAGALDLLRFGSPLAGDIPKTEVFETCFKGGLLTRKRLDSESSERHKAVLSSCSFSGSLDTDKCVLQDTEEEVKLGWAIGPVGACSYQDGIVSGRFPLVQKDKARMIDDFSISEVND